MAMVMGQIDRRASFPTDSDSRITGFGLAAEAVDRSIREAERALVDPVYWKLSLERHREATARVDVELSRLRARFAELMAMQAGWFDGDGVAVDRAVLGRAQLLLDQLVKRDVPRPRVFPTLEGGVQLEWSHGQYETSVTVQPAEAPVSAMTVNVRTGETREWQLDIMPSVASIAGLVLIPDP